MKDFYSCYIPSPPMQYELNVKSSYFYLCHGPNIRLALTKHKIMNRVDEDNETSVVPAYH